MPTCPRGEEAGCGDCVASLVRLDGTSGEATARGDRSCDCRVDDDGNGGGAVGDAALALCRCSCASSLDVDAIAGECSWARGSRLGASGVGPLISFTIGFLARGGEISAAILDEEVFGIAKGWLYGV